MWVPEGNLLTFDLKRSIQNCDRGVDPWEGTGASSWASLLFEACVTTPALQRDGSVHKPQPFHTSMGRELQAVAATGVAAVATTNTTASAANMRLYCKRPRAAAVPRTVQGPGNVARVTVQYPHATLPDVDLTSR